MEDSVSSPNDWTEHKYKGSYEQIAKTILRYSSAPETGCRQFQGTSVVLLAYGQCRHAPQKFSLYSLNPGVLAADTGL